MVEFTSPFGPLLDPNRVRSNVTAGLSGLAPQPSDGIVDGEGRSPAQVRLRQLGARLAQEQAQTQTQLDTTPVFMFDPTARRFSVNGATFAEEDVVSALASSRYLDAAPQAPPAGNWVPISRGVYNSYLASLDDRRGFKGNLAIGARGAAESLIGGVGVLAEMAGAEDVGPAISGFAKATFGQSEFEQQRSAYISQSNTLWENILDGVVQGIPSFATSLIPGIGGAKLGVMALGATLGKATAATAGGFVGSGLTIFPMEVQAVHDAAVQHGADVSSSETQMEILTTALATTILQTAAPGMVASALSPAVRKAAAAAATQVARGAVRNSLRGAVKVGLAEGTAEGVAQLMQSTVFDPEVRRLLTVSDWKALAPYIVENYGEQTLIAFGAGAFLGAGIGGAANLRATGGPPVSDNSGADPVDLIRRRPATPPPPGPGVPPVDVPPAPPADVPPVPGVPPVDVPPAPPADVPPAPGVPPADVPPVPGVPPVGVPPAPPVDVPPAPGVPPVGVPPRARKTLRVPPVPGVPPVDVPPVPGVPPVGVPPRARKTLRVPPVPGVPPVNVPPVPGVPPVDVPPVPGVPPVGVPPRARKTLRVPPVPGVPPVDVPPVPGVPPVDVPPVPGVPPVDVPGTERGSTMEARLIANYNNATKGAALKKPATKGAALKKPATKGAALKKPKAAEPKAAESLAKTFALKKIKPDARTLTKQQSEAVEDNVGAGEADEDTVRSSYIPREVPKDVKMAEDARSILDDTGVQDAKKVREAATKRDKKLAKAMGAPDTTSEGEVLADALDDDAEYTPQGQQDIFEAGVEGLRHVKAPDPRGATGAEKAQRAKARKEVQEAVDRKFPPGSPERGALEAEVKRRDDEAGAQRTNPASGEYDPVYHLQNLITLVNSKQRELNRPFQREFAAALRAVGTKSDAIMPDGTKLVDHATSQGLPNIRGGFITPRGGTGRNMLAGWTALGKMQHTDGTPVTPLSASKVKLTIKSYLSKLAKAPTVHVFTDHNDLKAKNPALHARAAAERTEGDFERADALGYSFGDGEVLIFTKFIGSERQLQFVLAHETVGHFGLRGLIPGRAVDAVMTHLYDTVPSIRAAADASMALEGLGKAEAVEEHLAGYAAVLDTSIIARIYAAIKGALNKLGITFGDEMTRYLVSQSRRYVRGGVSGAVQIDMENIVRDLMRVETGAGAVTGRFLTSGSVYSDSKWVELNRDRSTLPLSLGAAVKYFVGAAKNFAGSTDKAKSTFFGLSNYRALQNPGLTALEQILDKARDTAMSVRVVTNDIMAIALNRAGLGMGDITSAQTSAVNQLIYAAQRSLIVRGDLEQKLNDTPLFAVVDDKVEEIPAAIAALKADGLVTLDMARDGFDYDFDIEEDGATVTYTESFAGIPGLTKDSTEWQAYLATRETMSTVEIELLKARHSARIDNRSLSLRSIEGVFVPDVAGLTQKMTPDERAFVELMVEVFTEKYSKGAKVDARGNRTLDPKAAKAALDMLETFNKAIIIQATDTLDALVKTLDSVPPADVIAMVNQLRKKLVPRNATEKFILQNHVKQMGEEAMAASDSELSLKHSILTGYTPVLREGNFQMRGIITDPMTGEALHPDDAYRSSMIYSQFTAMSDAEDATRQANEVFGAEDAGARQIYKMKVYDNATGTFALKDVNIHFVSEAALDAVAAPPGMHLNDFVRALRQFDIVLTPEKVEKLITALTRQGNVARQRLKRAFTPGASDDAIMAVSRHVEARASTIAKVAAAPKLAELMNLSLASSQKLWNGDAERVVQLKTNMDQLLASPVASADAKTSAKAEYQQYRYMFDQTNPQMKSWDGNEGTRTAAVTASGTARGNQFYKEGARTVAFLDGNATLGVSALEASDGASRLRAWTSIAQLGGSIATGVLNLASIYTNWLPLMATHNTKTGFGGGFGAGRAVMELHRAMVSVGVQGIVNMEANKAGYYDKIAADPALQTKTGLNQHEAEFIAREIREGVLIPAQSNALNATARGRMVHGWSQKLVDLWMAPFNLTEQAARRTTGLAAYRMYYDRAVGAGQTASDAAETARIAAVKSVNLSMGEYSVLNRPHFFRQGLQSFLYMYKVFPTTTVQLLANLSRTGQIGMLSALWLMGGVAAFPFAEDLEDLVDTIAQKLGFRSGAIRIEIAKAIEGVLPGMSKEILGGVLNQIFPGDVASRVSIGNMIPGTGMFIAGADKTQQLGEVAGPMFSMVAHTVDTAINAVRAVSSPTTGVVDVLRASPVTMGRALGDVVAFTSAGAIVDKRGYVVSEDLNLVTLLARITGFYPSAASSQFAAIKYMMRATNYQREATTAFKQAWLKRALEGDTVGMREIERTVEQWNVHAKGTPSEIRNFKKNAMQARKLAMLPAGERALKSAPRAAQRDAEEFLRFMTD